MSPGLAVLGLIVVVAIICFSMYNGLVRRRNDVSNGWAYIEVELMRRHDLIPNLVETVKGYAAHEQETLERAVAARNAARAVVPGPAASSGPEQSLSGAVQQLIALGEAYPDLKANTQFLELQEQLADTEDRIAVARRIYNANVRDYRNALETVPQGWFARFGTFPKADFFQATESERKLQNLSEVGEIPPPS